MNACPRCSARMVCRDDYRNVCLACGWVRDDTIEEELAAFARGELPLPAGPSVAISHAYGKVGPIFHSGERAAEDVDDGYVYGHDGERHTRKLIGGDA